MYTGPRDSAKETKNRFGDMMVVQGIQDDIASALWNDEVWGSWVAL